MTVKNLHPILSIKGFLGKKSDTKTTTYFSQLIALSQIANENNKFFAIQGGFAVDLAIGYLSRPHDDADVVILHKDYQWWVNVLKSHEYEVAPKLIATESWSIHAYRYYTELGDRVYFDFDCIEIEKDIVSDGSGEDRFIWPITSDSLCWQRKIGESSLSLLSPYLVYNFKKRQQKRDTKRQKENQDFKNLEAVYPEIIRYNY